MIEKIKQIFKRKNDWKIYLYYQNQLIKTLRKDITFKPLEEIYIIKVRNKKHLLGTNKRIQIVCVFNKLKYSNTLTKEVHIEVKLYEGVEM